MNRIRNITLVTLQDTEDAIREANNGTLQSISIEEINKRHGAIRDASRLQALATIARSSHNNTLNIHGSHNVDFVLNELCVYAPALTAVRLNKFIMIGQQKISRYRALEYATDKMINTDLKKYSEVIKGRVIDLCCISGAKRQYLAPLFSSRDPNSVKDSSEMSKSLIEIFKEIGREDFYNLEGELLKGFGVFTCELFKNTQEHARKDENGMPYPSHVEGIISSYVNSNAELYKSDFISNPRLKEYYESKIELKSNGEKLHCIQISFFDTGPGITGRAFGKKSYEGSLSDEKEDLISCLQKNFTSKNQSGAGNGYPTILNQLRKVGGLIRIRTGRHCIFNCFSGNELASNIDEKDAELLNFESWSEEGLALAAGTVVSILVPLRKESGQSSLF
ncbi:hypothetical protein SAMN05518863_103328 [Candidatus Pantoea symbiotica]|uniref:ATP-binding protein n=1 Tax=Candidatus Pantoea symbiotica TaxID=1884370 RepID=A0A1I3VB65_9GAMM|nr:MULTISPECIES: hypothetical protein [Pantoea]SFJ92229.1 hypothetical protein SAMN05518863_103328 [Pantoea symbiotica]SFU64008.1 hypothetical protein SAMN05518864_103328 [Pantoea sp. YR525]